MHRCCLLSVILVVPVLACPMSAAGQTYRRVMTPTDYYFPPLPGSHNGFADLNGDGWLDLVSRRDSTVGIVLGQGDGTFSPLTRYPVGAWPSHLAVGDVNGDGDLDLVTASESSDSVSVLLGDGCGAFAAGVQYPTGDGCFRAALSDLDHDGDVDLVTLNRRADTVTVLHNVGGGTFSAPTSYPGERWSSEDSPPTLGDVDGDGHLDVVTLGRFSQSVTILRNNGDATFALLGRESAGPNAARLFFEDLDTDSDPDLVIVRDADSTVAPGAFVVLLNDGDGDYQAQPVQPVGLHLQDASLKDLNGDGASDLVVVNGAADNVGVSLGNGDGTFQAEVRTAVFDLPEAGIVEDMDGDGDLDVVTRHGPTNQPGATVLLNRGDATFAERKRHQLSNAEWPRLWTSTTMERWTWRRWHGTATPGESSLFSTMVRRPFPRSPTRRATAPTASCLVT
jgi:hypothetical protein